MAKYETSIKGNFSDFFQTLSKDIEYDAFSMNLVEHSSHSFDNVRIEVMVYDKYFMRNGNRASLSVTLVSKDDDIFVTAIGAGGGSGVLFNFSLGAEDDMVYIVEKSVEKFKKSNS